MSYTYEEFIGALDANNKELKNSLKFEQLAKTIFANTDKDSVVINVNGTSYYRFSDGRKITLNLRPDGSLFFETNIDKDYYNKKIVEYTDLYDYKTIKKFIECSTKSTCGPFIPIDSLIVSEYFSPKNIYYYFSQRIINQLIDSDYSEWAGLFDIKDDFRDLKKAKLVTYSKVKGTTDYKIKFKPSGNEYQLQYATAPMAREFGGIEFFETKINSYAREFNNKKVLMIEALLIDLYNEAKLIYTEILPEIESAKKQIYDFYKANQSSIKAKLEESFNAYISDTQNPASYIMTYKNGTWQTVDEASYDDVMADKYNGPIYAKYDRLTNQLIKLHLSEVPFYKVVDYYISN